MEPVSDYADAFRKLDDGMKRPTHGLWVMQCGRTPWNWFFDYFEIEEDGATYYRRVNRLDGAFEWVCKKLSRVVR